MTTGHYFTTCGATGANGPSSTQIADYYNSVAAWGNTYVSVGDFQGYQDWTVPVSGRYSFDVKGASGYMGSGNGDVGRGARISAELELVKGEIITVVVGQMGEAPSSGDTYGGSGGASFVVRKNGNQPLIIAGGGSSSVDATGNYRDGGDGQLTERGGVGFNDAAGGSGGFGGPAQGGYSGGGGGFRGNGEDGSREAGGKGFFEGLSPVDVSGTGGRGGFGGAGNSDGINGQSGGAGGYSGGAGARTFNSRYSGGGGGSFINESAVNVGTSNGTYEEISLFGGAAISDLDSYNYGDGSVAMELLESFTTGNTLHPTAEDANAGTNTIAIEPAGSSYHSLVPINYDIDSNTIYSTSAHGFETEQAVSFSIDNPTPDITNGQVYYIVKQDDFSYKLVSLPADVDSGNSVNFSVPAGKTNDGDFVTRLIINAQLDTFNIPNHGFTLDQPILYSNGGGTSIPPLLDGSTYYVSEVVDADNFKIKNSLNANSSVDLEGPGEGSGHSFIFLTVNLGVDTLYIQNHGLSSGQVVRYTNNGGSSVGGLSDDTEYFVDRIDDSTIRLHTDQSLSVASTVDLTNTGTGTHSLFIETIDFVENSISIPNHGFKSGELVQYDSRGQDPLDGLTTGQQYYVILVDVDNIKLATSIENVNNGTAIDITDSPAGSGIHSLTSLVQTPDGIYEITPGAPPAESFQVRARGIVPNLVTPINPRSTVNIENNTLYAPSYGFLTGTKVTYSVSAGETPIGGLTNLPGVGGTDNEYYVVTVNQDYFKLASTLENALANNVIELTDFGTGTGHSLTTNQLNGTVVGSGNVSVEQGSILVNGNGTSFSKILKVGDKFTLYPQNIREELTFADSNVNTANDRIEIAHSFETGDIVRFNVGSGVAPTPIIDGYYYYVGVVDANAFQLYSSKSAAISGTNFVTFSSTGSGSDFTLLEEQPRGPIVRKITAVGSDTQITVERPYAEAHTEVDYAYPTFVYVRPSGYSLHRPFDGGVEMSTGNTTSYGQIIRQTRKYFRYQSGKGIQISFAINFKPSIDIELMERFSSTQVLVTTRRPHNLIDGLLVQINEAQDSTGAESTTFNGNFPVTVRDDLRFLINASVPEGVESTAYGFPQFHVTSWTNGALRSGMFDSQNGMFFEFDGQEIYAVRRSSTQQTAGTASALRGSELIFGDKTRFSAQFAEGDNIVMRGQSYRVIDIESDTRMSVRPEYRGSTGLELIFDPGTQLDLGSGVFSITGHGLSNKIPIEYNSIDGDQIGGLINGNTYYADVIDANSFRVLPTPDSVSPVAISSPGTTAVHSFVPAKSGIIITKTVDTKVKQSDWNVDTCDGEGPSGYNLDLSRIQMAYMDYSWYGAGKIRFGFKTNDGLVRYVHEFKHNNILYESYFRSGNLPGRYEVSTGLEPSYIPSLFHWGTSVIMDGRFDDDRGYLFTAGSQTLDISGTTTKSFASSGINVSDDLITSLTHGFRTGDKIQFQSISANGLVGVDAENPQTQITGSNTSPNLESNETYKVFVNSPDKIHLVPKNAPIRGFNDFEGGIRTQQDGDLVTVYAQDHGYSTGDYIGVYGSSRVSGGSYNITVLDANRFTYSIFSSQEFTSPGTTSWTAPAGVTEVSVVAVGGGGGGNRGDSVNAGGGGGGGLGWRYRVPVVPGEDYTVVVGARGIRDTDSDGGFNSTDGGDSYFISTATVAGFGGQRGQEGSGGTGGGFVGDGGGNGGRGGNSDGDDAGGGGGAGGYAGNGGNGGDPDQNGQDGQGGAGGGSGSADSGDSSGGGGGVGIDGIGESGQGSAESGGDSLGGGGGSGGQDGTRGDGPQGNGGNYGGGGGGADNDNGENGQGGVGAVKLIWNESGQLVNTYPDPGSRFVAEGTDIDVLFAEVLNFTSQGNIQYTYFLYPDGSLNNTSGPNYQPLLSLRLSPSVDSGLTGKLGDRDIINRMQVRMRELGVSTNELLEVKLILNGRLNNLGFTPVPQPSLVELVQHSTQDTISGGIQIYNFQAEGGANGDKSNTTVDIDTLFELSNSILGGDNIFPDGPDILTVAVSRLTGNETRASAKLSWGEAQA